MFSVIGLALRPQPASQPAPGRSRWRPLLTAVPANRMQWSAVHL